MNYEHRQHQPPLFQGFSLIPLHIYENGIVVHVRSNLANMPVRFQACGATKPA